MVASFNDHILLNDYLFLNVFKAGRALLFNLLLLLFATFWSVHSGPTLWSLYSDRYILVATFWSLHSRRFVGGSLPYCVPLPLFGWMVEWRADKIALASVDRAVGSIPGLGSLSQLPCPRLPCPPTRHMSLRMLIVDGGFQWARAMIIIYGYKLATLSLLFYSAF